MAIDALNRLELVLHRFGDENEAEAAAAFSRFRALCKSNDIHTVDLRLRHEQGSGDLRRTYLEYETEKYRAEITLLHKQIASLEAQVVTLNRRVASLIQEKTKLETTTLRLQQIINKTAPPEIKPSPLPKKPYKEPRSHQARKASGQEMVVALLRRPEGATVPEIAETMGWQPHTTRAFISRNIRRKLKIMVTTAKVDNRGTVYRISEES